MLHKGSVTASVVELHRYIALHINSFLFNLNTSNAKGLKLQYEVSVSHSVAHSCIIVPACSASSLNLLIGLQN